MPGRKGAPMEYSASPLRVGRHMYPVLLGIVSTVRLRSNRHATVRCWVGPRRNEQLPKRRANAYLHDCFRRAPAVGAGACR